MRSLVLFRQDEPVNKKVIVETFEMVQARCQSGEPVEIHITFLNEGNRSAVLDINYLKEVMVASDAPLLYFASEEFADVARALVEELQRKKIVNRTVVYLMSGVRDKIIYPKES